MRRTPSSVPALTTRTIKPPSTVGFLAVDSAPCRRAKILLPMNRDRRPEEAAHAAALRAEDARKRRAAAALRDAELAGEAENRGRGPRVAAQRAADAARAAELALARAIDAHERTAAAHEEAARLHEYVASAAEKRGNAAVAARHRELAAVAREAAQSASRSALEARQRS